MRTYPGQTRKPRRAAAAAEAAVLAPFLVFVFVVTVDFSRIFRQSVTVVDCARNGALYLSAPLVFRATAGNPQSTPVGFVLSADRLVTLQRTAAGSIDAVPLPQGYSHFR